MSRPVHFEILAKNPEKLAAFYADLFGWKVDTWEGEGEGYWPVTTGEEAAVGINGAFMGAHFPQAVINTIQVDSLEESMERVKAGGGQVVHGPNEIPGVGMHSYCTDPEGTWFGILEPAPEG
jgi:predicted enzyme related to lactoylglutathione lyase